MFTVPATVPSVFHRPVLDPKYNTPLKGVNELGYRGYNAAVRSEASTVPVAVPSLFQKSLACWSSFAEKYSSPLKLNRWLGFEPLFPFGWMSLTIWVPAAVPLLFHSS